MDQFLSQQSSHVAVFPIDFSLMNTDNRKIPLLIYEKDGGPALSLIRRYLVNDFPLLLVYLLDAVLPPDQSPLMQHQTISVLGVQTHEIAA
jgi:hypothetical protein